jgi:hypothetical protein
LFVLCLVVRPVYSQTGNVTGTITGLVTDPSGAVISSAAVTATNSDTGFSRSGVSNQQGQYEIPLVPIGTYAITVTSPGYGAYEQHGIQVSLDSASVVDAHLNIGSSAQTVSVTADASILNTENFDVAGGLNSLAVENAPITSRNTFNLALFAPGLNGTRDDEFGNPTFAFGGMQRKAFMIDGIDNTQRGGPGRLGIFSPENVKEIKVISGAVDAEYGRTVGGIINMVTDGGSNNFRGEFLLLERRPGFIAGLRSINRLRRSVNPFSNGPPTRSTSADPLSITNFSTISAASTNPKTVHIRSPLLRPTPLPLTCRPPKSASLHSSSGFSLTWAVLIISLIRPTTFIFATATI